MTFHPPPSDAASSRPVTAPVPDPSPLARRTGPAGATILVEPNHALPLVHVVVAIRSGAAWDPRKKDGLMSLLGNVARHGAGGKTREQLDQALDGLGASLDVETDADSLRFSGQVLTRNLDAYLRLVADIVLRPDFTSDELNRTRRELIANLDELRNDDHALAARFFLRNLYSLHPYGHAPEGDRASLERIRREDLQAHHRRHVVGANLILAAAGDVTADDFAARVQTTFASLPKGAALGANPLAVRSPLPPEGWRIQIVDKPDRQQAQVMFGHLGVPATDPDYLPLLVAVGSFGGPGMKATLMDELRSKRGLAYGTYMTHTESIGRGAVSGWFFTSTEKVVATLKLVLRLYVALMEKGLDEKRVAFVREFLAGAQATAMDSPDQRLDARLSAEIAGLSAGFVDSLPSRLRAVTASEVTAAIRRHVRAHDLAITVVATAGPLRSRLIEARVQPSAIDVVPYDSY